ncbi:MAG: flagellar biosynthetic protein FliR [Planctomycetales bacterium]
MDWLSLPNTLAPAESRLTAELWQGVLLQFFHFTLVLFRISGLMLVAPGFSHTAIPINVRIFLMIALAMVITPNLSRLTGEGFRRLDADRNGVLAKEEIPEVLRPRIQAIRQVSETDAEEDYENVGEREFRLVTQFPRSILDYVWIVAGELGLGLLLGLGAMTVLSCLQLAGQIIDQQTGLGLGEVFNPELNSSASMTGETLYLFGGVVFLIIGGQRMLLGSLLDTFQSFPVGQAFVSASSVEFASELVHRSLVLALLVSAPLLATMTVISLAMGFLGHTVPQINILVFGFPIRMLAGLFVLSLAFSGIAEQITDAVPLAIDQLRGVLSGFPSAAQGA